MTRPRFWVYADWRTIGLGFSITVNEAESFHDRAHGGIHVGPWHVCFAIKDRSKV